MPRRGDRVAAPPRPDAWDIRYADNTAAKKWEQLCRDSPSNARAAWVALTSDPRGRSNRRHPLQGSYRTVPLNGTEMDQWQYEVTRSGRIWYCIDDKKKTVWLTQVSVGHPRATE